MAIQLARPQPMLRATAIQFARPQPMLRATAIQFARPELIFSPMAIQLTLLVLGLILGLLGTATATDLISLRQVAHAWNVPVLSNATVDLRESMGTSLAHFLEPACAVLGYAMMLLAAALRAVPTWRARLSLRLARQTS